MRSAHDDPGVPVDVIRSVDAATAVGAYLKKPSDAVTDGSVARGPAGTVSVNVLGRYRDEAALVPRLPPRNLDVRFRTVHGSKGLEADFIVVANMATGTCGFPSTITDDPVLHLAMPAPELYEHAEERRLFYVVLTRARRAVTLITRPGSMSPFVVELIDSGQITVDGQPVASPDDGPTAAGTAAPVRVCPGCKKGTLVHRTGPHGPFLGCSTFPRCRHTQSQATQRPGPASPPGRPKPAAP